MEFNEIRKEATNKVLEIMRLINEGINFVNQPHKCPLNVGSYPI